MVKLIVICKRKAGMALDEFQHYWRTDHAELVAGQKGLKRYVQNHIIPPPTGPAELVFDAVAEAWFDHPGAAAELLRSPEYAAVRADEANLVEPSSMLAVMTDEVVILEGETSAKAPIKKSGTARPASAVKRISFFQRSPEMSDDQFGKHWREVHAPLVAGVPGCLRYVQCHPHRETRQTDRMPSIAGIEMAWFRDVDSVLAADDSSECERCLPDQRNFVAANRFATVIAREVEIGLSQPTANASQRLEGAS